MNLLSLVDPRLDNICQIRRKWYYLSGSLFLQSELGLYSFFMFLTIQKTRLSSVSGCSVSVPCSEFVRDRWKIEMLKESCSVQIACFGQPTKQRSFGREARDKALPIVVSRRLAVV